ncbi:FAD-dependent oxidoreductase [Pseudooceanicola sp. HF7]|uniref:NAD(P)/FAD-dependent oxidoreductase n=1 Tax=Pseudooceanicola sp. HF7 TaxID=2721560 RepID=UPI001431578C
MIGAGISGISVASALSGTARVAVLERENLPGYHATGRSAAILISSLGPPEIQALTQASLAFFKQDHGFGPKTPLLRARGLIMIAREDQREALAERAEEMLAHKRAVTLEAEEIRLRMPLLRPGYAVGGLYEAEARDIDLPGLMTLHREKLRHDGSELICNAEVFALQRHSGLWQLETAAGRFAAPVVVNAAGAWAEQLGALAGAAPLGLESLRRTGLFLEPPEGVTPEELPMVADVEGRFYLKPEAGRLMASPADSVLSLPGDVKPDPLDVALCLDRLRAAFDLPADLPARRLLSTWAGLRSFVADGVPVCGFDDRAKGFFWLAGQGGCGIQCSPALAALAGALIAGGPVPEGLDPEWFSPRRPGALG